ncbi:phage capsid protein [Niveispirillum sp. KHB5.9]|uniref:phage capsid protein n=1 Tax=Niveispirillum sp. KHB5.9 TaxID=3400269 RepID=UPI003A8802EF
MSGAPFVVSPAQVAVSVKFRNPAVTLIADEVLPRVTVNVKEFKYKKYDLAQGLTVPNTFVGRRGQPGEVEFTATELTDSAEDYGLDDPVPQDDIDQAKAAVSNGGIAHDPILDATEFLTDLILLDREVRTAGMVFNAGTYGSDNKIQLSGTDQFDHPDSDALGILTEGLEKVMIFRPNTLVIGQSAWTKLRTNPSMLAALQPNVAAPKGILTKEQVAELLEIERVIVGSGWVNNARKGQTVAPTRVWGGHCALLHINKQANAQRGITFGITAQYGSRIAGSMADSKIGLRGGQRVRVGETVREKIIASELGYFIQDAI